MKKSLLKRIIISEQVLNLNNLKLNVNLNILNEIKNLDKIKSREYLKKENIISITNYDDKIIKKYNSTLKEILNNNKNLFDFVDISFYGNKLNSSFVSSRIIRDIINKLNVKIIYECKNRKVVVFSNKIIDNNLIKKIDSIFNFFDLITKKNNNYFLEIFLSEKKKYLNENLDGFYPDNINSGATIPGNFIYIYRKEELIKVLFHELIHYLKLDMNDHQNYFMSIYSNINLKADMINPNEAYTELLALLLLNIWEHNYLNVDIELNNYVNKKLTLELGWSYYQISKILKYFKCYNSYEELFTTKCQFIQKTNVLSYFFLKTYFLQNINIILKDFSINSLKINLSIVKSILQNTNLRDQYFSNNINKTLKIYDQMKIKDSYSMRMTCTG